MICAAEDTQRDADLARDGGPFILIGAQGAGDAVCLTGAVRDLHLAYPGKFQVYYRGMYPDITRHSPYFMPGEPPTGTLRLVVGVHTRSYNEDCGHFATMWHPTLARAVGVPSIPVTRIGGDVQLSEREKYLIPPISSKPYWLVFAGGKNDFTTKWWPTSHYQAVVDALSERIQFVQCGHEDHRHPSLQNVINLVGKTGTREMCQLMYHAHGLLGPVSFGMHLAAAVETPTKNRRAAVIIAGGREPVQFTQYPGQRVLSKIGTLPCCGHGACFKYKQGHDCAYGVHSGESLYAKCMMQTSPTEVIEAIEGYLRADGIN